MAINALNYSVLRSEPRAPRIEVNLTVATVDEFETAATEYQTVSVPAYVDEFRATIANYYYSMDRLKKDLCAEYEGMTNGGIDYEHNTIAVHEKADEIFAYALDGGNLTEESIENTITRFGDFYSTYYQDDANENFIVNPLYEETGTYDTRAFTIDTTIDEVAQGSIFILDVPSTIGTDCTYTNYSGSTAQYVLSYDSSFQIDSETSVGAWVIRTAGEEQTNIAYSTGIVLEDGMTWEIAPIITPVSEPESTEPSEEP